MHQFYYAQVKYGIDTTVHTLIKEQHKSSINFLTIHLNIYVQKSEL